MAAVGRLLHYHGRDTYPKQGYTVARTWEECMKNAYVDYWREGTYLYTAEQVEAIRRETVEACAAVCSAKAAEVMLTSFQRHTAHQMEVAILALLPVKEPKE